MFNAVSPVNSRRVPRLELSYDPRIGGYKFRGSTAMKCIMATISLCMLVEGPAFAQSDGEKSGVNSVTGVAPSTADFVTEAAVRRHVRDPV
jgi:hypothetical protein